MSKVVTKAKKPSAKPVPRRSSPDKKVRAHKSSSKNPQPVASTKMVARSTKRDQVLELLRSRDGATIQEIAATTRWQTHSIRGFLAGVVRKKLGLNLTSTMADRGRVYRIDDKSRAARSVEASKKRA